ncbi:unnamed protein product, partial [Urochloa humidicola]
LPDPPLPTSGEAKRTGRQSSARRPLPCPRRQHVRRSAFLRQRPIPINGDRLLRPASPSPAPAVASSSRRPHPHRRRPPPPPGVPVLGPGGRPPLRHPLPTGVPQPRRIAVVGPPLPSRVGQAAPRAGRLPPLGPRRRGHLLLPAAPHELTEHIPMVQPIVSPCLDFMAGKRTARQPREGAC